MNSFKKFLFILVLTIGFCAIATPTAYAKQSPVAGAGKNLYLDSGDQKKLDGSGSDLDGTALTYNWDCTGGELSSYNIAQPTFTAPNIIGFSNKDIIACTLTVKDEDDLTNSDTIKIYINYDNEEDVVDIDVKTKSPTDVYSNKATLNGSFEIINNNVDAVWFQYGFTNNYGKETEHQSISSNSDSFSKTVSSLFLNATYHYRAVAQDEKGNKFYGQDMIFVTENNYIQYSKSNWLSFSSQVANASAKDIVWGKSVNANPSNLLSFSVTITANGGDLNNVIVKNIAPENVNIVYKKNILVNTKAFYGDVNSGINIGTIKNGQTTTVYFQACVAESSKFAYGVSNLTNTISVDSDESEVKIDNLAIVINNFQVSGASTTNPTDLATGLTNNLFTESFLLPMLLIIAGSWLYFSGRIYQFADWLSTKL